MTTKEQSRFARKLVQLSLDETGRLSSERVGLVLEALRKSPPAGLRPLLKQYLRLSERERRKYTARIECAGSLEASMQSDLREFLETHYGRSIDFEIQENTALIAGLRVRIADDVWERSVAATLERLRNAA
ncbi:MAG: F0F1 ATP synthase subunit delta [Opitutales bacterium]